MRIEHIAMYVSDLEKAKDFFVNFFSGIPNECYYNRTAGFRSYFIMFDSGARLELMQKDHIFDAGDPGNRIGYAESCIAAIDGNLIEITV